MSAERATVEIDGRESTRRRFVAFFASAGLGSTLLPGALWARAQEAEGGRIDAETVAHAERLAGIELTDSERELLLDGLRRNLASFVRLREVELPNSEAPALRFDPRPPGFRLEEEATAPVWTEEPVPELPTKPEDLALWPVTRLARLVKDRKITSLELTRLYLERLKRLDAKLHCVITLTEELALRQARRADEEIAAGRYRGPLHGIPWGAKDLLATRGYRTTWGAKPYAEQVIDEDATVVERLEAAGAVLIAKLTLGALAWGDVWFAERTRNPWSPDRGSSGSSAGPGAATAAGLVGFSIGSETWGSIVSPSTVCGVTGLRPTFGRVSRHGAMALSWSMDKLGPMCRSVEDCALVLEAIRGPDGRDPTVIDAPFPWDPRRDPKTIRVGYLRAEMDGAVQGPRGRNDRAVLETLRGLGVELVPVELPDEPAEAMAFVLNVEAAAAFDRLTRENRDDELVRQVAQAWPNVFRQSRFVPAVEYLQANRARSRLMRRMAELFESVDVYVAPSFSRSLLITNLTGHPAISVPNGFDGSGLPTSITFTGQLFGEAALLRVAKAYQDATDWHTRRPPTS